MVSVPHLGGRILTFGVLSLYLGLWFHELSHWAVGRAKTKEMEIQYSLKIFPHGVVYGDLDSFSERYLRLTAVAPQLILLPYISLFYLIRGMPDASDWLLSGSVIDLVITSVFFAAFAGAIVPSPADFIAVFCQDEFRNWEERGHGDKGHIELARLLINCLRRNHRQ